MEYTKNKRYNHSVKRKDCTIGKISLTSNIFSIKRGSAQQIKDKEGDIIDLCEEIETSANPIKIMGFHNDSIKNFYSIIHASNSDNTFDTKNTSKIYSESTKDLKEKNSKKASIKSIFNRQRKKADTEQKKIAKIFRDGNLLKESSVIEKNYISTKKLG